MRIYAFIDATNLHLGIKSLGWILDYKRFRIYLTEKYGVSKAYMFMGYSQKQERMYRFLRQVGYILEFKPIFELEDGSTKGNCDAELVLRVMLDLHEYDQAVIVSGDGDFSCLIKCLQEKRKLNRLIAPNPQRCSTLLKKLVGKELVFLHELKNKLGYKQKGPHEDKTS